MSTQWANIGEDAGALHALVQQVPSHVAIDLIDYVWIFPPRRIAIGESVVVVVGAFAEDTTRRRVITARFTVSRNKKGVAQVTPRFDEHGTAPEPAVARIVQGVLRRLGEDAEAEPREEQIGGDVLRWDALIVDLGGRPPVREATNPSDAAVDDAAAASVHTEDAGEAAGSGAHNAAESDAAGAAASETRARAAQSRTPQP